MTPLLGTKTSSAPVENAPAGDDKAAQVTSFQVFTRPETQATALAWREAQAGASSEVFTKHETRNTKHGFFQARNTAFPWLLWCSLVLKPFSLFFGRETVYVESDDAVAGNKKPIRALRGRIGWGRKSRQVAAFLRVVARHGAAMARHGRHGAPRAAVRAPSAPATGPFGFSRDTSFHEFRGFHESRDTKRAFLVRSTAFSWSGAGLGAVAGNKKPIRARRGRRREFRGFHEPLSAHDQQQGLTKHDDQTRGTAIARREAQAGANSEVFTSHETRITNHGFYASLPTISHDFPAFPSISRPPPPPRSRVRAPFASSIRPVGFSRHTRHESRTLPPPVAAFLRVVARHGAAMVRHGRHGAPRAVIRAPSAPATGTFGFSRNPRPEAGYCQARRAGCPLGRREFRGFHESRDTNHGLDALFIIVHDCSPLFAIVQQKILSRPAPLATAPVSSRLLPLRPTQDEPMLREGNVRCCDDTLLSSHDISLHVSPRGEAKCVRGPSGRGACHPRQQHGPLAFHETRNTRHESRPFIACFDRRVVRKAGWEAILTPTVRFGILPLHGGLVQATGLLYRPGFGRQGRRYLHHVSNLPAVNRWG